MSPNDMDDAIDPRARIAWRAALWASALNVLGSPMELVISRGVVSMPRWAPLGASAFGILLFTILLWRRERPTRGFAALAFLLNSAAVIGCMWVENARWSTLGTQWTPFQGDKLGALVVGLLTPELIVGLVAIAGYAAAVTIQWAMFSPEVRASLTRGEPMVTIIFAGVAVFILVSATRRYAFERRLIEQQRDAAALEELARALLAVRDFANTPLQVIASAAAVVQLKHPEAESQVAQIERALERLRRLNQLLSRHEANIRWRKEDESFDAMARLEGTAPPQRSEH
jgi:hypothetical protein